jgi:hypothetical protein
VLECGLTHKRERWVVEVTLVLRAVEAKEADRWAGLEEQCQF